MILLHLHRRNPAVDSVKQRCIKVNLGSRFLSATIPLFPKEHSIAFATTPQSSRLSTLSLRSHIDRIISIHTLFILPTGFEITLPIFHPVIQSHFTVLYRIIYLKNTFLYGVYILQSTLKFSERWVSLPRPSPRCPRC